MKTITTLVLLSFALSAGRALPAAAADSSVTDSTKEAAEKAKTSVNGAVEDAKKAVQDAGDAAADSFNSLWRRVDESRLKNRSRDEIVAWIIMGVLVGSVAGMFTSLKSSVA